MSLKKYFWTAGGSRCQNGGNCGGTARDSKLIWRCTAKEAPRVVPSSSYM